MKFHVRVFLMCTLILGVIASGVFATGSAPAAVSGPAVTAPGEFPIVTEPVTIDIFASLHPYTADMNTTWFTHYYEDMTNVHVNWEQIPDEQASEKVNILLAAGDLPDAFLHGDFTFTRSQLMQQGAAGTFIALNDLINRHSVHLKGIFEERPYVRAAMTAPDGNIYAFPAINECHHCVHPVRAWINRPWLEKLGLEVPTTTEELYNVLVAFKTQDPNGNGLADEIPLAGAIARGGYNNQVDMFLMNSFIYTYYEASGERSFVQAIDGKISFVANTPQWREGLRYLRRLYREGLVDPESFTQTRDPGLKQKSESPDAQILGFVPSGSISAFNIYYGESGRYTEWELVAPLAGPNGFRTTVTSPHRILPGLEVTSAADRPDVITRWADWFYTQEGTLTASMGEEGVGWRWAEPGEIGADGNPAIYLQLTPFGRKDPYGWASTTIRDQNARLFLGQSSGRPFAQEPILFAARELYNNYETEEFLPYLWFSEEDAVEMAELQLAIVEYVSSADAEFIVGRRNVDGADWNTYLRDLQSIGVDRYVELTQKAYDAYLAVQ